MGKRRDYTYDVPDEAIFVSMSKTDASSDSVSIGSGNGEATLRWDRNARKAHVHAWVNGKVSGKNHIQWTVYAWLRC